MYSYISSLRTSSFKDGYDYYLLHAQAYSAANSVFQSSGSYLLDIDSKIGLLRDVIIANANNNPSNHGYLAEYWHAYTYNISSSILRSSSWAAVQDSPEARQQLGGADILTSFLGKIGLKYHKTPNESAFAQATTVKQRYMEYRSKHPECSFHDYLRINNLDDKTDPNSSLYEGQARIIPSDQVKDAIKALNKRINHDLNSGSPEQSKDVASLIETRDALIDHIEGPNGEESFPLSFEQAKELQKCAKDGSFDPARFDIDAARLADKAFLLSNAVNAGFTAAWTSFIVKIAPIIIRVINQAIREGRVSQDDLVSLYKDGASGLSTGFLRGSLVAAITSSAELGYLGKNVQKAALSPSFSSGVAVLVSVAISIGVDAARLSRGRISQQEFSFRAEKTLFIASASYICGCAVQGILLEFPAIGYMLGSFVGSIFGGLAFNMKEAIFMSACVEHGWTFFGIVEQDYSIPPELESIFNLDSISYDQVIIDEIHPDVISIDEVEYDLVNYDTISIRFVTRGVVGIRKVGFLEV